MNQDALRQLCLSFPEATENVQWGADLVFKIGGKMFAVTCLEPGKPKVSFKCTPEEFAELVELEDVKPADYVARYHWVALEAWSALPDREIRRLIKQSYDLVKAKVPSSKLKGPARNGPATRRSGRPRTVTAAPTSRKGKR
jgi:predicted DNA-binding protein (MmcQ/YjbR family)